MDGYTNIKHFVMRSRVYFAIMGLLSFIDILSDITSAYQFLVGFNESLYFAFSIAVIAISLYTNIKETSELKV